MAESSVKYRKPKVLLIDMPASAVTALESLGYNVRSGTFGRAYPVDLPRSMTSSIVLPNDELPNLDEQEIVFIDLTNPSPDTTRVGAAEIPVGQRGYVTAPIDGLVDPRPLVMAGCKAKIDRIVNAGGIVVVFVQPRGSVAYRAYETGWRSGRLAYEERATDVDNYSFSSYLQFPRMDVTPESGHEVSASGTNMICKLLARHFSAVEFTASIKLYHHTNNKSSGAESCSLLRNKYGSCVAGEIEVYPKGGLVVLLPQFADKAAVVVDLMAEYFATHCSSLFPEHEKSRWIHLDEYEHLYVMKLRSDIRAIEEEAIKNKEKIAQQIEEERQRLGFLHGLLTKSGDELVQDAITALLYLGFRDVADADKTRGPHANKEEDIWVRDRTPPLIFEVKGLGALPSEADTQQLVKYLNRRKTEWRTTELQGVFLVNHQLGIQPLQRDHKNVFTPAQTRDATNDGIGLMTTWDLFRLIRGMEKWSWPAETIQAVFCGTGRIGLAPSHWTRIGRVAHFYDKQQVVSIEIEADGELREGDTVGYVLANGFEQETVEAPEVDHVRVASAKSGDKIGFKTGFSRSQLPEGLQVYRVDQSSS